MGASTQTPLYKNKEQLKTTHPSLQKSVIVIQEQKSFIQTSFPIQQQYYNIWRASVTKAANSPNASFLFLPLDLGYVQSDQMLAKNGYVVANYPNYPIILSEEIKQRKIQNAFFKEKQLYFLLYALTAVKMESKSRGELVGDIKPDNIFINAEQHVKVASIHSFPYEKPNYNKFLDIINPSTNVLLAPQDLQLARQNGVDNRSHTHSEVYSIGATILSAGILENLSICYDYPSKLFKNDEHTRVSEQWMAHQNYSQLFKSIILNLVNVDPEQRMSIEDIWAFVSKYQSSILLKEQFLVNNPPPVFESGVSIIRSKIQ